MFPHTLVLVLASAVVAALVGVPIGIISALKRRSPLIDYPLRIFALLGLSMPVFWLGILLLIVFSLRLDLFPLIGGGDLDGVIQMLRTGEAFLYPRDFLKAIGDVLYHLTLPALALGFTLAATVSRLSRSAMLEVISQDYIRTARAKGQGERAVVYKHALRNMMVPLLTIVGLFVAIALTGTVLTETVFTRARARENAGRRHRRPRLPAGPGRHHGLHHDHHHRQSRGRHALRGRRPTHHVPLGSRESHAMAVVRDAAAPELTVPGVRGTAPPIDQPSRYLRRYGPIGIGVLLALAMVVMAAGAPIPCPA